jgi:hypothetical protein
LRYLPTIVVSNVHERRSDVTKKRFFWALIAAPLLTACASDTTSVISCPLLKIPQQVEAGATSTCKEVRGDLDPDLIELEERSCEAGARAGSACPPERLVGACRVTLPSKNGTIDATDYYYAPLPSGVTAQSLEELCPGTWVVG